MARVLPSHKPFSEVVSLSGLGFAKQPSAFDQVEKVITSKTAGVVTAGISRIRDEIDYADRVEAEKRRVAGADVAENKAQAALQAMQEQRAAREARLAEIEEARRAEEIRATVAASPIAQVLEGADMARFMSPITPRRAHPQSERGVPIEPLDISPEVRGVYADVFSSDLMRQAGLTPEPVVEPLEQERVMDFSPPDVIEAMEPPPAAITPEQLAEAQARLAAAQKAAAIPEAFIPKTIADFRFKVRDLETRFLQADPADKQALANQIRQTISNARGAVDMQPKDVMEAFTRAAGKRAQKKAYDEMTITEKEFLKQMYAASKEKRAEAAEGRAIAKEGRAEEKHTDWANRVKAKARAAARRGRGTAAVDYALVASHGENFEAYKNKTGIFSNEAIHEQAGRGQSLSAAETDAIRKEMWHRLTTDPNTGRSLSGATEKNLSSVAASMGMSKDARKEAKASQAGISKSIGADLKRKQKLEDLQAKRDLAIEKAMNAAPGGAPLGAAKDYVNKMADSKFYEVMDKEGLDYEDEEDKAKAAKVAVDLAIAEWNRLYPALVDAGEQPQEQPQWPPELPGTWNRRSMEILTGTAPTPRPDN